LCNLHYEKFANGTIKCIEDEIPFELPEGWSWERLSNLASFSGGKTPSTSKREYWEGNILWVTSKDMKCKYIDSSLLMISEKGLEQMQLYPENTLLLVTRSGILRHTIPVAILKKPATINQDLKAIMLYIPNLEEYIYICIKGMESRLILEYTKAGATVENINFDAFQKILLPIPPENQIQRIIDATNDTDEVIGKLKTDQEDLIDIIDKTKSKILDLAIHGKLVPQNPDDEPASTLLERIKAEKEELIKAGKIKRDKKESVIFKGEDNSYYRNYENESVCIDENIPFEIPSNWEWCNLSMIGSTNIGLTYKPEDIIENGTMVLRSSNIVNGKIDLSDLVRVKTSIRDNQYIEENDILICARNGSKALV
jgi:type I restriction enzyme S subunit